MWHDKNIQSQKGLLKKTNAFIIIDLRNSSDDEEIIRLVITNIGLWNRGRSTLLLGVMSIVLDNVPGKCDTMYVWRK